MEKNVLQQFRLDGRVAIVAGGNRGLGLEIAKTLAGAGARIAIAARDEKSNEQAQQIITKDWGVDCSSTVCEITSEVSVNTMAQGVVDRFGRIDILINSAGINIRGKIGELSLEDFNRVQQVNVTGSWLTSRAVIPHMKHNGYGRIVNIGSMLSVIAMPERTPYATSKGAVLQLTRALAMELAQDKINVNAMLPGPFATEMNLSIMNDPEKYKSFISRIPMGRWGELHEIGGLALFLSSPASSFVTGASISIDGGWTTQ